MKIIRHTKNCLELESQDPYTAKVALSFGMTFLAIGILLNILGFNTAVVLIAGSFILIFGAITANFEMNCQFDRKLNLFKLSYCNLIRHKKIERFLSDINDVRLEQDTDVEGGIFYWLVIMMKSGEEIHIPHLLHTLCDIKTYELIVTEVRSFILDTI
jgi:hypothetical protein